MAFKRVVMTVCMSIWNMVSMAQQMEVREKLMRFLPCIEELRNTDDAEIAAAEFLGLAHAMVDDTEVKGVEALQQHYDHHQRRKEEAGGGRNHRAEAK